MCVCVFACVFHPFHFSIKNVHLFIHSFIFNCECDSIYKSRCQCLSLFHLYAQKRTHSYCVRVMNFRHVTSKLWQTTHEVQCYCLNLVKLSRSMANHNRCFLLDSLIRTMTVNCDGVQYHKFCCHRCGFFPSSSYSLIFADLRLFDHFDCDHWFFFCLKSVFFFSEKNCLKRTVTYQAIAETKKRHNIYKNGEKKL